MPLVLPKLRKLVSFTVSGENGEEKQYIREIENTEEAMNNLAIEFEDAVGLDVQRVVGIIGFGHVRTKPKKDSEGNIIGQTIVNIFDSAESSNVHGTYSRFIFEEDIDGNILSDIKVIDATIPNLHSKLGLNSAIPDHPNVPTRKDEEF